jgi:hypothetical protein
MGRGIESSNTLRISGLPATPGQLARESAQVEEIELLAELIVRANQVNDRLAFAEIDQVLFCPDRAVA